MRGCERTGRNTADQEGSGQLAWSGHFLESKPEVGLKALRSCAGWRLSPSLGLAGTERVLTEGHRCRASGVGEASSAGQSPCPHCAMQESPVGSWRVPGWVPACAPGLVRALFGVWGHWPRHTPRTNPSTWGQGAETDPGAAGGPRLRGHTHFQRMGLRFLGPWAHPQRVGGLLLSTSHHEVQPSCL